MTFEEWHKQNYETEGDEIRTYSKAAMEEAWNAAADELNEKYEKQKEINKELVDENEALKFAARMSEKTELQLRKENAELKAGNRWHDLRKDPKDLPDEGIYLVVWQNARGYKQRMTMLYEEDDEEKLHWIDGEGDCWDDDVIAWRDFPEFEEAD